MYGLPFPPRTFFLVEEYMLNATRRQIFPSLAKPRSEKTARPSTSWQSGGRTYRIISHLNLAIDGESAADAMNRWGRRSCAWTSPLGK